jgi:hypothetical protein
VWALDAQYVDAGGLGIRTAEAGQATDLGGPALGRRLVVADARRIHAQLFGEVVARHRPGPRTARLTLYTVGVDGVPTMHLEEALWVSVEALGGE